MIFKALIIEDEEPARNLIKKFLEDFDNIELINECDNGFEGVKFINDFKPDLIFLDIQMPKITGFEMLELIDHMPQIIFTTAFDQYAIKAFEVNAADYILKPFSKERFTEAVNKALYMIAHNQKKPLAPVAEAYQKEKKEFLTRIAIKSGTKIDVIQASDIFYVKADDDYIEIYTRKGKFLKEKTLKSLEAELNPQHFRRVHRSYLVNLSEIRKIEHYTKDSYSALLTNGDKVKISNSGYKELKDVLKL